MKLPLLTIPALLAFSSAAFASPFIKRATSYDASGIDLIKSLRQHLAIQTDTDRPLEIFGGGLLLQQTAFDQFGLLVHSSVSLPQPEKDPYAANHAEVNFESGRGDAGDIDGDGDTDLVYTALLRHGNSVTSTETQNVRIMACRNNGNGTWTRLWQLKDVSAPTSGAPAVKLADLDRDGDLDLIETYDGLRIRWNPGDGNFNGTPTVLRSTVFPYVPDVVVADFDGNGWPDIVIMALVAPNPSKPFDNLISRIELLSNTGGAFTTSVLPSSPGRQDFGSCAVADLNADGKPDLVTFQSPPLEMVWRQNTGSGFLSPTVLKFFTSAPAFVPADLNSDGIPDIAFDGADAGAQWLRGLGNGVFANAGVLIPGNGIASNINNINVADRDGDGDADILSVSSTAGVVRIRSNNGTGSSWLPQNVETGLISPDTIAAGQLISGGRPEIALLRADAMDIYRHTTSTGWNGGGVNYQFGATGSRAVVVADIDGGNPGPEAFFALNDNTIRYWSENPANLGNLSTSPQPVKQLAAADWNADGFLDLLAATTAGVNLYRNSNNTTDGSPPLNPTAIPLLTGVSIMDLVTLDLNGDSFTDAVAVDTTGRLYLLYNGSSAVKITPNSYPTQTIPPGNSVTVAGAGATYQGNSALSMTRGALAAPGAVKLRFFRSTPVGGVDAPGTTLTAAEVAALMDSISLTKQVGTLQTGPAATVFGDFTLNLTTASRQALSIGKGQSATSHGIRLNLKATAASAPVTRFYVEHDAASPWVALDDAGGADPTPLRLTSPAPDPRTLVVIPTPTAFQNWRFSNFGTYDATGTAANDADPDGDNLPNIMEYATGRDPKSSGGLGSNVPLEMTFVNRETPVQLDLRVLTAYDSWIKLTLQSSTNMGTWSTLSTRTGTGVWSAAPSSSVLLGGGSRTWFKFNANGTPQSTLN